MPNEKQKFGAWKGMTEERARSVVARGALWVSAKFDPRAKGEANLIRELWQCKRGAR